MDKSEINLPNAWRSHAFGGGGGGGGGGVRFNPSHSLRHKLSHPSVGLCRGHGHDYM